MGASGWHRRDNNSPAARARKREYDSREYRQAHAQAARIVSRGDAYCWRCTGWIEPDGTWHLGHDDHNRAIIRGPEHASCNLTAAAKAGNLAARGITEPTPASYPIATSD
jgi:hypothetical protein